MGVLTVLLCIIGLAWWAADMARWHRERVEACPGHEWEYVSLFDQGRAHEWMRRCRRCPEQEPVRDEEVCRRLSREHREGRSHRGPDALG